MGRMEGHDLDGRVSAGTRTVRPFVRRRICESRRIDATWRQTTLPSAGVRAAGAGGRLRGWPDPGTPAMTSLAESILATAAREATAATGG